MLVLATGFVWSIIVLSSNAAFHRPDPYLIRNLDSYSSIEIGPKTRHSEPVMTRNLSPLEYFAFLSTTYKFHINQTSIDDESLKPVCSYIIMSTEDQSEQQLVLSRQLAHELVMRNQFYQFPPTIIVAVGDDRTVHFMTKSLGMHIIFRDAENGTDKFTNCIMPPMTASFKEAAQPGIQLLIIPQWLAYDAQWPHEAEELAKVLSGLCDDFLVASFASS